MKQNEIRYVNLNPTVGDEMKKIRPCLIISPDVMNQYLSTVVIAPITSKKKKFPFRIEVDTLEGEIEGWICLDQIRTLDKGRFVEENDPVDIITLETDKKVKNMMNEIYVL